MKPDKTIIYLYMFFLASINKPQSSNVCITGKFIKRVHPFIPSFFPGDLRILSFGVNVDVDKFFVKNNIFRHKLNAPYCVEVR